jgi:hypothetical protein
MKPFNGRVVHVLITVDPDRGAANCMKALEAALERNGVVFRSQPRGRSKAPGDQFRRALHDLAIWRLDMWLKREKGLQWTADNRRADNKKWVESKQEPGKGHYDARPYWGHQSANGPIYHPGSKDWDKAISRAKRYLEHHFGQERLGIIPAVTRSTRDSPHFRHLGPERMQVATVAVAAVREVKTSHRGRPDSQQTKARVVPRFLARLDPEMVAYLGQIGDKWYQFAGDSPDSPVLRDQKGQRICVTFSRDKKK